MDQRSNMEREQPKWAPTSSWQEDGNGLSDEGESPDANEFNSLLQNLLGAKDSQQAPTTASEMAMLPIPTGKSFADLLWEEEERKAGPPLTEIAPPGAECSHSSSPGTVSGRQSPGSVLSSGGDPTFLGGKNTMFVPVTPIWGERRSRLSESPESANGPPSVISSRLIAAERPTSGASSDADANPGFAANPLSASSKPAGLTSGVGLTSEVPKRELWADSPTWNGVIGDTSEVRKLSSGRGRIASQSPSWGRGTGKPLSNAMSGFGRGQGSPSADFPPLGGVRAGQTQPPEKVVDSREFPELPRAGPPKSGAPRKEEVSQARGVMKLRNLKDLGSVLSPHQNAWTCWNPVTGSKESQEDIEAAQKEMAAHLRTAQTKSLPKSESDCNADAWEEDERAAAKSEASSRESEPQFSWEQQPGSRDVTRWPVGRSLEEMENRGFSNQSRIHTSARASGSPGGAQGAYPPRPISRSDAADSWRRKEPLRAQSSPSTKSEPQSEESSNLSPASSPAAQENRESATSEGASREAVVTSASGGAEESVRGDENKLEIAGLGAADSLREAQTSKSGQDSAGQLERDDVEVAQLMAAWEEAAVNSVEELDTTAGSAPQESKAASEGVESPCAPVDEGVTGRESPVTTLQACATGEASLLSATVAEGVSESHLNVTQQAPFKAEELAQSELASNSDEPLRSRTETSGLLPHSKPLSPFGSPASPLIAAGFGAKQDALQPQVPRPFGQSASDGLTSPTGGFADLDAAIIAAKQSRHKKPPETWQGMSSAPGGATSPGGNLRALWVPKTNVGGWQKLGQASVSPQEGSETKVEATTATAEKNILEVVSPKVEKTTAGPETNVSKSSSPKAEETTGRAETNSLEIVSPKAETKSEVSVSKANGEQAKTASEPSLVNRREMLMQMITQRWRAPLGKQPLVRAESRGSDSELEGMYTERAASEISEQDSSDVGRIERSPFPGYTAEDLAGRQQKIAQERREEVSDVNSNLQREAEDASERSGLGERSILTGTDEDIPTIENVGLVSEAAAGVNEQTDRAQSLAGDLAIASEKGVWVPKKNGVTAEEATAASARIDSQASSSGEPVAETLGDSNRAASEGLTPGRLAGNTEESSEGTRAMDDSNGQSSNAEGSAALSVSTDTGGAKPNGALHEEGALQLDGLGQLNPTGWGDLSDDSSQANDLFVMENTKDPEPCKTSETDAKQGAAQENAKAANVDATDSVQGPTEGESQAEMGLKEGALYQTNGHEEAVSTTPEKLWSDDFESQEVVSKEGPKADAFQAPMLRTSLPVETTVLHQQNGVLQNKQSESASSVGAKDNGASAKADVDVWTFPEEALVPAKVSESAARPSVNKAPKSNVNGAASASKAGRKTVLDGAEESFERLFVDVYQKLAFKLGRPFDISILLTELKKRVPGFDVKQSKYTRFVDLCNAMADKGHVRIFRASNMTFAALPDDPAQYGWGPNGLYQLPVGTNRPKSAADNRSSNGQHPPAGGQSQGQSGSPKPKTSSVAKAPQPTKANVPRTSSAPGLVVSKASGEQSALPRSTSVQNPPVVKPAAAANNKGPERKRSRAQVEAEALGALMLFLCETPSQQASDLGSKLITHDRSLSEQVKLYFGGVKAFLAARPELFYVSESHAHNPLISLYTGQERSKGASVSSSKAGAPPKPPAVSQTPSTNPRSASQAKQYERVNQNGNFQKTGVQTSDGASQGLEYRNYEGRGETFPRSGSEASTSQQPRTNNPPRYGGSAQQGGAFGAASNPPNPKKAEWHLYLANLPMDCPADELKAALSRFGQVHALSLPRGRVFGFARFTSPQSAEAALTQRFIEVGKRKVVLHKYNA